MSLEYPEPPTKETLADARKILESSRSSVDEVSQKIDAAEAALAQIIFESRCAINQLKIEQSRLNERVFSTMAYLSPIRRLPTEMLREIYWWIRLITSQHASADTIRLWLERSGDTVPLDIEIYLRVANGKSSDSSGRPGRPSSPSTPTTPTWQSYTPPLPPHYVIPHSSHTHPPGITILPPANTPIIIPPSPPSHDSWSVSSSSSEKSNANVSKTSMHWGHIAIFYLVEQMPRWERFVFRFDKHFTSMGALKAISGDAPLLKEFEVSSAEAAFFAEWPWLPNASPSTSLVLPKLKVLTLQYTPFKWSSPMLRTNLHTLNLRALPTSHLPLDRILYIVANNLTLQNLSLHFQGVVPAILPLTQTTLPHLKSLTIGGHFSLTQLVDSLILPSLDSLTLDIEARDAIEDTIASLLVRSSHPAVEHLSIAYGSASNAPSFYYGPGGILISWGTLLAALSHLKCLQVGGTPLEPLLTTLGPPDDEMNQLSSWACPGLEKLGMRNCHANSEGVGKLVQMVDARNPKVHGGSGTGAVVVNGVSPTRLKALELNDCASLGQDVVKWLSGRIDEVKCTEPQFDSW